MTVQQITTHTQTDAVQALVPGARWIHVRAKRPVVIEADRGSHVDFHYVQGLGGTQLWRRGVTPTQTFVRTEFLKFFRPETGDGV